MSERGQQPNLGDARRSRFGIDVCQLREPRMNGDLACIILEKKTSACGIRTPNRYHFKGLHPVPFLSKRRVGLEFRHQELALAGTVSESSTLTQSRPAAFSSAARM